MKIKNNTTVDKVIISLAEMNSASSIIAQECYYHLQCFVEHERLTDPESLAIKRNLEDKNNWKYLADSTCQL